MASDVLEQLIGALRANPPLAGDTLHAMRESMERMTAAMPLPEDAGFRAVDAGGVPAEWTSVPGSRDDRTVVYLHGGGYALGSVATHRPLAARIARAAEARVLSVDYRLGPEHPHPAAVQDACAAMRFARSGGPERLWLAGDSAGGGLTVAALVALRDAGEPLPHAAACISPWLDLTLSGESVKTRAADDPLVDEGKLRLMASAYLGGADPEQPTASPLFADLRGLPPILVQVGSAEILLDDARRFAGRAAAAGTDCRLEVWPDMIHVWHAFADALPEARQAIHQLATHLTAN